MICNVCQEDKDCSGFHKKQSSKTGYNLTCKECRKIETKQYRETHTEEIRLRKKEWGQTPSAKEGKARYRARMREENPEKAQTYQLEYRKTHREEINATRRKHYTEHPSVKERALRWRHGNPEKAKEIAKRWYENHTETALERSRAWQKANPDKVRQIAVVSEARKRTRKSLDQKNDLTTAQWREILVAYDNKCVYCPPNCKECKNRSHRLTQDHVTPASQGGSTTLWNIVPACRSCNSQKRTGPVPVPVQPLLLTQEPPRL